MLRLIAPGTSNAKIAADLVVSGTTVKTHVGTSSPNSGARDRVQAVIIAYERGSDGTGSPQA